MQVILLNTNNGSAFEMKFSSAREMKNYLEKNADVEFLTECNSYLPTRHQRMQHPVWKARAIFYAKWCATKHNTTFIHRNARITRANDLMSSPQFQYSKELTDRLRSLHLDPGSAV